MSEGRERMRTTSMRMSVALGSILMAMVASLAMCAVQASADPEIKTFELEPSTAQAGGHPNIFLRLSFGTKEQETNEQREEPTNEPNECYCADPRTFTVHFPTGFIGNPHAVPNCTLAQLGLYRCPPDSQVGISSALSGQQFVYNMEPRPGEPGLIATRTPLLGSPVFTILRARTDSDYGLDVTTSDIFHIIGLSNLRLWLWGVPTDRANDKYRAAPGRQFQQGCYREYPEPCVETPVAATAPPAPYLQAPTSCEGAVTAGVEVTYYSHEHLQAESGWPPTTGCDLLGFNPSLIAKPTSESADSPSGLDIVARVPQEQSPTVPSPSELKSLKLVLPEGLTVNPNAADGKSSCTDAESAIGTLDEAFCPQSSKIGTLSIDSAALPAPINGAMYLGEPKPGNRYRLIFAADGFETHVKLEGTVELDQTTGRVITRFENLPQSPLQEFDVHIFGADRGLFATPAKCGTYSVDSEFVPWASEVSPVVTSDSFEIDRGPDGTPCPSGARPLGPKMVAGSPDNTAGAYTPLAVRVDRPDGDQNMTGLKVVTPPGFLASLRGVSYCPEQAIALLDEPGYSGRPEQASPACPVASQVGTATTAAGAGSSPLYSPGSVYLAGPYKGAPVSLVVVVPAVSGPYDLGTVAVRAAVYINRLTAQITTVSDPLPEILEGIPLRLRSVLVNLDRAGFSRNPTNCSPFSVDSALTGDEGATGLGSAFYQVANCAALPFAPKLALKLNGSTKQAGNPALTATLTAKPGEANISRAQVTLPPTELVDNAHISSPCARVEFNAGNTPGERCPPSSILGFAKAETPLLDKPLEGPIYLSSTGRAGLPDVVAALNGQIDIVLDGRVDSVHGRLRTTFETVPDAPITKVILSFDGGHKGLVENSPQLCARAQHFTSALTGQNGTTIKQRSSMETSCAKPAAKRRKHGVKRARAVR
jgi:hypothetical protein